MPEPPDQPDVLAGSTLVGLSRVLAALILLSLPLAAAGAETKGRDAVTPPAEDRSGNHGVTADDSPAGQASQPPDASALPLSDGRQLGEPLSPEDERRAIENGWQQP